MAAAVRDAAEFLDVDVDELAGTVTFVTADWFAGGPVEGGQGGQMVPHESVEAAMPVLAASRTGPMRCSRRSRTTCSSTVAGVCRGDRSGRLERSCIPAAPSRR
ncbi:hypothetical protein GCM10009601_44650 [Streptomyces thermospinosisporus]|uniref:Uncharacterized protein n=1 Tax=Streptomyces thermospinosisporus TaxID=161482 RepID=A0ABN1Z471_9ACTN